ncbi:hypothetical protein FBQ82_05820 [Anaerolineae bacterium CFX7]|nr:hypothetical protein [Anaerolineae bacterium CFX7]
MKTSRQLQSKFQSVCLKYLPEWRKRSSYGLYRCTDDFVQWILFDDSRFNVQLVPHYAVQALAEQFPKEALTLGRRVQNARGGDLWIEPDSWQEQENETIRSIMAQVEPPALKPFGAQEVIEFLDRFGVSHVSAMTTYGIALVVLGNVDKGRVYLVHAAHLYKKMKAPWAEQNEQQIQSWLAHSPDELLRILRQDAKKGAKLLRLAEH